MFRNYWKEERKESKEEGKRGRLWKEGFPCHFRCWLLQVPGSLYTGGTLDLPVHFVVTLAFLRPCMMFFFPSLSKYPLCPGPGPGAGHPVVTVMVELEPTKAKVAAWVWAR